MKALEYDITVTANYLDDLNHVNNVVYVQWVNDIAKAHWEKVASQHIKNKYFWVLMSHTIDYKKAAVLNDTITVKTYIIESSSITSLRAVDMYNTETKELVAQSKTKWCFMNALTQRPTRITPEIEELFN
ncbi:acyl-CoA thioesterase [Bizionia gelidisalsuginis]|uniref:Acyl-CoA thioesterase n=2 Tax=Bizionia TaxID=283785 RepID=A0A8H2LE61_9FLAO|nr:MULTISPECIES: acyl-ACP thioesterase domain-containing protein [Bizionia]TYB77331.1 acyl-CoA thioesterase [Bizionia saleffrena]TYC17987.1 acyl-CoA thioesterase [Bizionia gelidisalsuginis]